MAFKFVVFAVCLAAANAGHLHAPVAYSAAAYAYNGYAAAPVAYSAGYAAAPVAYSAGYASPLIKSYYH
ncbi:hypothetical protein CBL_04773 [Carabus blaptoides fortunei]